MTKKTKRILWIIIALYVVFFIAIPRGRRYFSYRGFINDPTFAPLVRRTLETLDLTGHAPAPNVDLGYAQFYIPEGFELKAFAPRSTTARRAPNPTQGLKRIAEYDNGLRVVWGPLPYENKPVVFLNEYQGDWCVAHRLPLPEKTFDSMLRDLDRWWRDREVAKLRPTDNTPRLNINGLTEPITCDFGWYQIQYQAQPIAPWRVLLMTQKTYARHALSMAIKTQVAAQVSTLYAYDTEHVQGVVMYYAGYQSWMTIIYDKHSRLTQYFSIKNPQDSDTPLNLLGSLRYTVGDARTQSELLRLCTEIDTTPPEPALPEVAP